MSVGGCCRELMVTGPAAVSGLGVGIEIERVANVTIELAGAVAVVRTNVRSVIGDPPLSMYNVEGCAGWAAQSLMHE